VPYAEPNSAADFAIVALLTLGANASAVEILHQGADRSDLEIALKISRTLSASSSTITSFLLHTGIAKSYRPPVQMPLRLEAAILSRTRSPITSRSN